MTQPAPKSGAAPHIVLWLMAGLVGSAVVWSAVGQLDVVSAAMGEVVPSSQVKTVEHLEGGIVRDILVREGERVVAGQPLVSLDPVRSDADVQALRVRITDLSINEARLEAESTGAASLEFPAAIAKSQPELLSRARDLFQTRRDRQENRLKSQDERIAQRSNEIEAIQQRVANNRRRLKLVSEQIKISEGLMQDQLTNRMNHLNLLKEGAALESRISEDSQALPRAEAALSEAKAQRFELANEYLLEVREELASTRSELREAQARLTKFEDALSRTVLRSPVDGIVKSLHIATVGGVVRAGEPVADIVPVSDRLVIEARLPAQDIGYVRAGQPVLVSLASADSIRFGRIEGEVTNVSPDTIDTQEGIPYYKVRVETGANQFESGAVTYELVPGVQVACAIRTGQRSVLAYLLDPVMSSVQTALRER